MFLDGRTMPGAPRGGPIARRFKVYEDLRKEIDGVCFVDDHLGCDVRQFTSLPGFHLLPHRFEVSLHSIHNRDAVDE